MYIPNSAYGFAFVLGKCAMEEIRVGSSSKLKFNH